MQYGPIPNSILDIQYLDIQYLHLLCRYWISNIGYYHGSKKLSKLLEKSKILSENEKNPPSTIKEEV